MTKGVLVLGSSVSQHSKILSIIGVILFFLMWEVAPRLELVNSKTVPPLSTVVQAFPRLMEDHKHPLFESMANTVKLNIQGVALAFALSLIVGGVMGLYSEPKDLFFYPTESLKFVPPTALTAMFVSMFGIGAAMKLMFMMFVIAVYGIAMVRDTIMNVPKELIQTAKTLGATNWQLFKDIYLKQCMPDIFKSMGTLSAISWTYIIVAESFNMATPALGAMMWLYPKKGDIAAGYALLLIIIVIAALFTLSINLAHQLMWPHKYETSLRDKISGYIFSTKEPAVKNE